MTVAAIKKLVSLLFGTKKHGINLEFTKAREAIANEMASRGMARSGEHYGRQMELLEKTALRWLDTLYGCWHTVLTGHRQPWDRQLAGQAKDMAARVVSSFLDSEGYEYSWYGPGGAQHEDNLNRIKADAAGIFGKKVEVTLLSCTDTEKRAHVQEASREEAGGASAAQEIAPADIETEQEPRVLVAFADIRGFTAWCTSESLVDVTAVLTEFDRLAKSLRVPPDFTKRLGDGFLGVWLLPPPNEQEAFARARVDDLLKLISDYQHLENDPRFDFGIPPKIGVGVCLGRVKRIQYKDPDSPDFVGKYMNLASRLQDIARPGGLVAEAKRLGFLSSDKWVAQEFEVEVTGLGGMVKVLASADVEKPSVAPKSQAAEPLNASQASPVQALKPGPARVPQADQKEILRMLLSTMRIQRTDALGQIERMAMSNATPNRAVCKQLHMNAANEGYDDEERAKSLIALTSAKHWSSAGLFRYLLLDRQRKCDSQLANALVGFFFAAPPDAFGTLATQAASPTIDLLALEEHRQAALVRLFWLALGMVLVMAPPPSLPKSAVLNTIAAVAKKLLNSPYPQVKKDAEAVVARIR